MDLMQIGVGYWGLPAIDRRIEYLKRKKPAKWRGRLKRLRTLRREILVSGDQSYPVKGWRGHSVRKKRYLDIKQMLKSMNGAEVGRRVGLSRQRVHQIMIRGV